MATRKPKIVGIYPEPQNVTQESTERLLIACEKILELCAGEELTISDMQSLPEVLCGQVRRAISKQISGEIFKNINSR